MSRIFFINFFYLDLLWWQHLKVRYLKINLISWITILCEYFLFYFERSRAWSKRHWEVKSRITRFCLLKTWGSTHNRIYSWQCLARGGKFWWSIVIKSYRFISRYCYFGVWMKTDTSFSLLMFKILLHRVANKYFIFSIAFFFKFISSIIVS